MSKTIRHLPFLALLAAGLLPACVETAGPIDRVQPDGVDKSLFSGEWYYRPTVIDAPYTSAYTFIGDQAPLERIVWDIQEDALYAYRSYEHVENAERSGFRQDVEVRGETPDGVRFFGDAVAVFRIVKHFDVRRAYNTSTGEPGNVREENTSDRPWYEREWMRVEWSANQAPYLGFTLGNFNTPGAGLGDWESYQGEEMPSDVAPVFEEDRVEVVTNYHLEPATIDYPGFGTIPLCYFYPFGTGAIYDCDEEYLQLRHAFVRVDPSDYAAKPYDDHDMERFGLFRTERLYYDRERGITESGRLNYAQRHPVWVDEAGCVEPDAPHPHAGCEVRTIVYHLNEDFPLGRPASPTDLVDTRELIDRFGVEAFAEAIDLNALAVALGKSSVAELIPKPLWRNLDLADEDDRLTAAEAALGELDLWDERDEAAVTEALLEGLGLTEVFSEGGPVNLESVEDSAFAFMDEWNQSLRAAVAGATGRPLAEVDDVLVLCHNPARDDDAAACHASDQAPDLLKRNGDLRWSFLFWVAVPNQVGLGGYGPSSADPLSGEIRSASAYVYGGNMRQWSAWSADYVTVQAGIRTENEVTGSGRHVRREVRGRAGYEPDEARRLARSLVEPDVRARVLAGGLPKTDTDFARARLARLRNAPELEDLMLFDDIRALFPDPRFRPGQASELLPDQRERSALRSWLHRGDALVRERRLRELQKRNLFFMDYLDGALEGYAKKFSEAWEGAQDALGREGVRREVAKAVFHDWIKYELITDSFHAVAAHEVGHTLGLRHNFEGSVDALNFHRGYWELRGEDGHPGQALTDEQAAGGMLEYAYSSIMDYHGRLNADFQGIGPYDVAAVKYSYGGLVEVFEEPPDEGTVVGLTVPPPVEDPMPLWDGGSDRLERALRRVHYTGLPELFGGTDNLFARRDVPLARVADDDVEVPYRFCSDELVYARPDCLRFDIGADPWEIARRALERYEDYRPFYTSSRDRVTFPWFGWSSTVRFNYFLPMVLQYQHFVLDYVRHNTGDFWERAYGQPWEEDEDGGLAGALASAELLNLMALVLGRPTPGDYCRRRDTDVYEVARQGVTYDQGDCRSIRADDGAVDLYNDFSYDTYDYRIERIGSVYDRLAAFETLTDPTLLTFGPLEPQADLTRYLIGMQTLFPRETMQLLGGVVLDDYDRYGWVVGPEGVRPRKLVGTPEELDAQAGYGGINPYREYTFPTTKYRLPIIAAYYGMALMTGDFDNSFSDITRVYLVGNEAEIDPDVPPRDVETYTDPLNGRQYRAYKVTDGRRIPNVAWELVREAKRLSQRYEDDDELREDYNLSELQFVTGKLDLLRAMHQAYEYGD